MIKYLLFTCTATLTLYYLYAMQPVSSGSYPMPVFELFAPLLFATAGILYLINKSKPAAITALLALGIIAKDTIGLWHIITAALQTKYANLIVASLSSITIIFFALLGVVVYTLVSPPTQKYSTMEQLADKPAVKILAFIPLVVISVITLLWVVYFVLKSPHTG